MIIERIENRSNGLRVEARGHLQSDTWAADIWFRWRGIGSETPGDAFLLFALRPAMRHDETLHIRGTVSEHLVKHLDDIQKRLKFADKTLSIIDVSVENVRSSETIERDLEPRGQDLNTGAMVTGGLETFYIVQRHLAEIDHLVYVRGFEDRSDGIPFQFNTLKTVKRSASELNIHLIEMDTNLLDFYSKLGERDNALGITAVGSLLSGQLHVLYIPHNQAHTILFSHNEQDRALRDLVGSHLFKIEQTGIDVSRKRKVEAVASNETVMETLRICWENPNRAYNCGRCKRCSRTMSDLEIVHALL